MYLTKTPIPGMSELSNVGYNSSDAEYDKVMTPANLKGVGIVVASLTMDQKAGIDFLLGKGFVQVGEPKVNPNTHHTIVLLVKHF